MDQLVAGPEVNELNYNPPADKASLVGDGV